MTTPTVAPSVDAVRDGTVRRLLHSPLAVTSLVVFAAVVGVSLLAPLLAPYDPNEVIAGLARATPGEGHPMGGDGAGRDVLSRLLFAGRITLLGALVTIVVAMAIGIPSGLLAGYYGRWFDSVSTWFANVLIAIPSMVVLLAVISAVGPRTVVIMAFFGVLLSPSFFRLVRTAVITVRGELYVDAARIAGLSDGRIIARHIATVVRAPIIIQASISAGIAVLMQTGIQFLGLGEQGVPSWGQMLADAFTNIFAAPFLVIWPGVTIGVTVAALALFGNALRDALEDRPKVPRARRRAVEQEGRRAEEAARAAARGPESPSREHAVAGAILDVRGLSVSYPTPTGAKHVVSDVSLSVAPGEVLGLVGESGSGKSQTAFAVLGLLPQEASITGGAIDFDGAPLLGASRSARSALRGRRIAYVPQEPMSNLDPSFTIGHQLVQPMVACLGVSRSEARTRALALLERVGISDPRRTFAAYPHEVSGGMAQRVLIAGAVSCDPDLLIADEPTTALDVTVQAEVLDLLRELQRERGMAMVLVTHNFGVVADICDRVAVMQEGRIVEQATADDIFSAPQHPYTQMLLGSTLEGASLRRPVRERTPA
jgi:peptide/nickel transport system permease protein